KFLLFFKIKVKFIFITFCIYLYSITYSNLIKMGKTLTEKILEQHLVEGNLEKGSDIAIKIDQTLTQDATGTMAYLQFEAMDC
ncbi:unnamed protein product, partial [marine sediment metagenome]